MAAAEQGSGGVARHSGDGRGRRPRGEAERRPAQLGGAGARGSTVQGHADKACDGRRWQQSRQQLRRPCSGTGGAQNKGGKGRGARVTHHKPVLGVDLSGGWSEKRIDAREAELGLAPMAADGRVRIFGQLGQGGARVRGGDGGGGSEGARGARNRERIEQGRRTSAGESEWRELSRALLEEEERAK